jgi:DNA-binding CsgD family transcriptional regulator
VLRAALNEVADDEARLDVLGRLAMLNVLDGHDADLSQLLADEIPGDADSELRLAYEAAALDAMVMVPGRHAERARRAEAIDLSQVDDPLLRRVFLGHRAWLAAERGDPDADRVAALALQALSGDFLLDESPRRATYHLSVRALVLADHAKEAELAIDRLREDATARGSARMRSAAAWYAAELALRRGQVVEAESYARAALELVDDGPNVITGGATEVLVVALAERGAFSEAHELAPDSAGDAAWDVGLRHSAARLALAEGDFERAYTLALEAGARRAKEGRTNPARTPWRSTAALALAHLGRRDDAAALADEELTLAARFGAPVPIATALHARAVAEADLGERVGLCERALVVAGLAPTALVTSRVRITLGNALRNLGRRVEARGALVPALADADAGGAVLLAKEAQRELVATGLRPRRAATSGAAALTPRQRQVCELAAQGKSNRAIAHELFLSIKTVETHLALCFQKLGVAARSELGAALSG